ncbi:MAG: DUF2344 domain-containing protein [Clostridia bacterium]|nr:DUF2344 domain-containing protein [Clostridia bacterium]
MLKCYTKHQLPMLEQPKTVRIRFVKKGNLQYVSHLDLQRTLHRVLIRAGIPMWYTKGFNPHPKISFGYPLSIGTESVCEFLDMRIEREISMQDIMAQMNCELTDEMYVYDAYEAKTDANDVAFADYTVKICTTDGSPTLAGKITALLTRDELYMTKKTKSGDKEINLIPLIDDCKVGWCDECKSVVMKMRLATGSKQNLNPELLISALKRELDILSGDPTKEHYTIMRERFLTADYKEFR